MEWKDRLELLRWRALEEADAEGSLLPTPERAEATRQTSNGDRFLLDRADYLTLHANAALRNVIESLSVRSVGPWIWAAWGIAFIMGYGFAELGTDPHDMHTAETSLQGRLINVLALPLMSILLWNALVIITSLLMEARSSRDSNGLPNWLCRWTMKRELPLPDLNRRVVERFYARLSPLLSTRLASQTRTGLHIGAALLAFGTIIGMYAKGWSREYRAVWESTILDQSTASYACSPPSINPHP